MLGFGRKENYFTFQGYELKSTSAGGISTRPIHAQEVVWTLMMLP